jgi:hypothetical protein
MCYTISKQGRVEIVTSSFGFQIMVRCFDWQSMMSDLLRRKTDFHSWFETMMETIEYFRGDIDCSLRIKWEFAIQYQFCSSGRNRGISQWFCFFIYPDFIDNVSGNWSQRRPFVHWQFEFQANILLQWGNDLWNERSGALNQTDFGK